MAKLSRDDSVGSVLSALLKKFNLNALELERLSGVPSSTIYRLLNGKDGNPTIEVLKKLSSFFQITVSQLIGEEPIGNKQLSLVPPDKILKFLRSNASERSNYKTISIDFPMNSSCFATVCEDELMEPFISTNSIVIIDPDREISNKDFVILIKKGQNSPQIRQAVKDGGDIYLKILNAKYSIDLCKMENITQYDFIGVIIHYRTNLYNFSIDEVNENKGKIKNF